MTVHVHPACVVTASVALPPAVVKVVLAGESVEPAQGPAACETVWVAPAMTIEALRAAPLLAATE